MTCSGFSGKLLKPLAADEAQKRKSRRMKLGESRVRATRSISREKLLVLRAVKTPEILVFFAFGNSDVFIDYYPK
jgi:hypothetical protein